MYWVRCKGRCGMCTEKGGLCGVIAVHTVNLFLVFCGVVFSGCELGVMDGAV